ncbi:MAG: tetratricopeptide repeat protein [Candidatus Poribacteria bacterium]|nr:tetratricopeptide repeat protein [Candidatus Poribacteria bacterium]
MERYRTAWLAAALLVVACSADAARVRVTLPNGDRYTGDWVGASESQFGIRLEGGMEMQLPLAGTTLEFITEGGENVPSDAVQYLKAAMDAVELGLDETAVQAFREAITLSPKYARAHYEYARYLESAESSDAFNHYVLAAQLDPAGYPIGDKIRAAATEALANKDYLEAANALFTFSQTFPNDPDAASAAYDAAAYFRQSMNADSVASSARDRAIKAHDWATSQFPNKERSAETLFHLGSLYQKARLPEQSISALNRLLGSYPGSDYEAESFLVMGYAYLQLGDMNAVGAAAKTVLTLTDDPDLQDRALELASEVAWSIITTQEGMPGDEVFALSLDGSKVWAGTVYGITELSSESSPLKIVTNGAPISTSVVRAIASDAREVWIGTSGQGVIRYDKQTKASTTYTTLDRLPGNRIDTIALDSSEVWVGGLGGVSRFDRATGNWLRFTSESGFAGRNVTTIAMSPDSVWVGTRQSGLIRYDRAGNFWEAFTTTDGLSSNEIRSVVVTNRGVATSWYTENRKGIDEWDRNAGVWTPIPFGTDNVAPEDIYLSYHHGTLWVASGGTLLFRPPSLSWVGVSYPVAFEGSRVRCIVADDRWVWVGTNDGLGRLDVEMLQQVEE